MTGQCFLSASLAPKFASRVLVAHHVILADESTYFFSSKQLSDPVSNGLRSPTTLLGHLGEPRTENEPDVLPWESINESGAF